ncbi:MAG: VWA domain-containing protein [Tepidisphaeraceae bacterium]
MLDCSGSMLEEMNGKMKFDIARDAVKSIINSLPDNVEVGLRVYGHRKRAIEKDADKDVEELVRLSPLDRKTLLAKLDGLRARGKTPLAESLSQTAKTLNGQNGPTPINVILLTDGGEDTRPRGNPIAAAGEFAKLPNTRLKIIGFDINQEDWAKQLADMAAAGKGSYTAAANADKLAADLVAAVAGTPGDFAVVDANGKTVAAGAFGQTITLNPGKYQFQTAFAGETFKQDLYIAAGRATSIQFTP